MRWPIWRVVIAERSMEPALRPGDWLLVRRGIRSGRPPRIRPGQVIVARNPDNPGMLLVKRARWRGPGGWWLDSDNPAAGGVVDSWRFGPVRTELIEGRVLLRYRRTR
jgi:signal peptidase I